MSDHPAQKETPMAEDFVIPKPIEEVIKKFDLVTMPFNEF